MNGVPLGRPALGRHRELPRRVVVTCSKTPGRERYGVKLTFGGRQLRVGSRFCDVASAKAVGDAFTDVARECRPTETIDSPKTAPKPFKFDQNSMSKYNNVYCFVFLRWKREKVRVSVSSFLEAWISDYGTKKGWPGAGTKKRKMPLKNENPSSAPAAIWRALGDDGNSAKRPRTGSREGKSNGASANASLGAGSVMSGVIEASAKMSSTPCAADVVGGVDGGRSSGSGVGAAAMNSWSPQARNANGGASSAAASSILQNLREPVIRRSVWPTFSASSTSPSRYLYSTVASVVSQLQSVFAGSRGEGSKDYESGVAVQGMGGEMPAPGFTVGCPIRHRPFFQKKCAEMARKFGTGGAVAFSKQGLCYENGIIEALQGMSLYENLRRPERKYALNVADMPRIIFSLMSMIFSLEEHVCVENLDLKTFDGAPGYECRVILQRCNSPDDESLFILAYFVPTLGVDAVLRKRRSYEQERGSAK
jgi:hypothetical protein